MRSFKWVLLAIVFGVVAIYLYTAIDSKWAERTNAGIWMTISFFMAAVVTILCGFNAIDSHSPIAKQ
jgi:hypothetical protein